MESRRLFFDPSTCDGNMLFLGNRDPLFREGARSVMNMEGSSMMRPFFSSHEDLFDEEYYDEQMPEKKRRLTTEQVNMLEKSFEVEIKLEPERKTELAKKLGLQPRQVAVWFQNRRARWKTKQLERKYDLLKASYDSLHSDYDSIAKENEQLKSEVISLTQTLEAKKAAGEPLMDHLPAETIEVSTDQFPVKVEDRLSSGSGGSAVVDEDGTHLLDSCDSYFPSNEYPRCMGTIPSEDDGSDDVGPGYFSDIFVVADQQQHDEPLGWWVWS